MQFTPLNLQELTSNVWPEGAYEFRVINSVETVGQYGAQIQVDLEIYKNERKKKLRTWLGATSPKLAFFCMSVGLQAKYEHGDITDADCMLKKGYVMVNIGKTKNGDDVNNVVKFLTMSEYDLAVMALHKEFVEAVKGKDGFVQDDVPF